MVTNFVNSARHSSRSVTGCVRVLGGGRLGAAFAIAASIGAGAASAAPPTPAFDHCFELHGRTQGLAPDLLRAIAQTESSMRPQAMNAGHLGRTQSVDIGLMQINSRWLPDLAKFGVTRRDLDEPCTNIEVGAWILADLLRRKGSTWEAVGAYNAGCTELRGQACTAARATYAWKVYQNWPGRTAPERRNRGKAVAPGEAPMAAVRPGLLRIALLGGQKAMVADGAGQ